MSNNFVKVVEVGPRDGLQNEATVLTLNEKKNYINLLAKAGLKTIEAGSFVRAESIKQMAQTAELFSEIVNQQDFSHIDLPCLVPNLKGLENAKRVGVKNIALFTATSEKFTKSNINCTIDESFLRMKEVVDDKNETMKVRGYISTVFGCPYEGKTSVKRLMSVIEKLLKLGVYEISFGDTIGVATPSQVKGIIKEIKSVCQLDQIAMHFHDTRGMAIANTLVSLDAGVRTFDSSSGGLGGCPYAKGATGNLATEDLYYLCHSEGLETGIELNRLIIASSFILEKVGKQTPSKYLQTLLKEQI